MSYRSWDCDGSSYASSDSLEYSDRSDFSSEFPVGPCSTPSEYKSCVIEQTIVSDKYRFKSVPDLGLSQGYFYAKSIKTEASFDAAKEVCARDHSILPIIRAVEDLEMLCVLGHDTWLDMQYFNKNGKNGLTFGFELEEMVDWAPEITNPNVTHGQLFQSGECERMRWTPITDLDYYGTFICLQYIERKFFIDAKMY